MGQVVLERAGVVRPGPGRLAIPSVEIDDLARQRDGPLRQQHPCEEDRILPAREARILDPVGADEVGRNEIARVPEGLPELRFRAEVGEPAVFHGLDGRQFARAGFAVEQGQRPPDDLGAGLLRPVEQQRGGVPRQKVVGVQHPDISAARCREPGVARRRGAERRFVTDDPERARPARRLLRGSPPTGRSIRHRRR
jgi:hypothetical protein